MKILSEKHKQRIELARRITDRIPLDKIRIDIIDDPYLGFSQLDNRTRVKVVILIAGKKFVTLTVVDDEAKLESSFFIESARYALFKNLANRIPEAALSPSRLPI